MVDDQDFGLLNSFSWYAHRSKDSRTHYAARKRRKSEGYKSNTWVSMHSEILKPSNGMETDHIDQDGLNNQRGNLRAVTHAENMRNVSVKKNSGSRVVGVSFEKKFNRYKAHITVDGRTITIGRFKSLPEASEARRRAEIKHF